MSFSIEEMYALLFSGLSDPNIFVSLSLVSSCYKTDWTCSVSSLLSYS